MERRLEEAYQKEKAKNPSDFWGSLIAVASIWYGIFVFLVDGYLIAHAEPYMARLPEDTIGIGLIILGIMKMIGLISHHKLLKKIAIWGLSGIWTGLFVIATAFSFGTGYPHPSYIFMAFLMISCFRVSFKGDYKIE